MTSICLGLCRHLVLKATDNFYYFDIKYNVKLEIQKQFFLQHNMERMIFKLLDHRGILFKILQFEGKKCTFGPIHSSSVWRNKSLTLTLIHRAIEAYVGPWDLKFYLERASKFVSLIKKETVQNGNVDGW